MANIAYKRVSTVGQNTDRQLAECGIEFDKVFEDKASGKAMEGRPALEGMIDWVREGDTVHVHSMDRLARNLEDMLTIVKRINGKGAGIVFHSENLTFTNEGDDTKGTGKFLLSILGAVAEFERKMIRQRQREGIELAKERGAYKGRKPVSTEAIEKVDSLIAQGVSISKACAKAKVSRATYYRAKGREE